MQAWANFEPGDGVLVAMPLFHVAGANLGMLGLLQGARVVVMREVDIGQMLRQIEDHSIAHAFMAPAIINMLLQHPDQLKTLIHEPDLIASAVDEMLRYDSPSQVISRVALEDLTLHDIEIRAGEMVALVLGSANRDERVYTDPDTFDVRRNERQHLAFGHGSHFCTGGGLASLEVNMIFRRLIPMLPKARITSGPIA